MADNFNLRAFLTENKLTKNTQLLKEADETRGAYALIIDEDGNFIKEDLSYYSEESYLDPEGEELSGMEKVLNYPDTVSAWQHAPELRDSQDAQWKEAVAELGNSYTYYDVIGDSGENAVIAAIPQGSILTDYIQDEEDLDEEAPQGVEMEEGRDDKGKMAKTHVVYQASVQLGNDQVDDYFQHIRVTVKKGEDAEQRARELIKKYFEDKGVTFKQIRGIGKALNPEHYTTIEPDNTNENKMTSRDKYLTRLVENALGLQVTEEEVGMDGLPTRKADPRSPDFDPNDIPPPPKEMNVVVEKGDEMVAKEPLPKYENIEKLMKEIEEGTNKAMYEYKMKRMMEIAEMLEAKVSSLEEGEHAEYTDKKAINQMRKDIAALRKGEEKLRKEFDKKFNKKEKAAAPKAEKEVDAEKPTLQEGTFDLKKFLVENKLTANSRMLEEGQVVTHDANISGVERFAGKPLLGGYILDIKPGVANQVDIFISTEPDKKDGRQLRDFTLVGTATYSIGTRTSEMDAYLKQWTWKSALGQQLGQAEVGDRIVLKTIGDQLEKDNQDLIDYTKD